MFSNIFKTLHGVGDYIVYMDKEITMKIQQLLTKFEGTKKQHISWPAMLH